MVISTQIAVAAFGSVQYRAQGIWTAREICSVNYRCVDNAARGHRGFLGGEELDRLGRRHGRDVAGLEAEHPHARNELALELGSLSSLETTRQSVTSPDGAMVTSRTTLPCRRRLVTQGPAVERVDRRLVAIEDELDFLARVREALRLRPLRSTSSAGGAADGGAATRAVSWPLRPVEPPPNPLLIADTAMPPLPSPTLAVRSARSTRVFSPAPALSALASVLVFTSSWRSSASCCDSASRPVLAAFCFGSGLGLGCCFGSGGGLTTGSSNLGGSTGFGFGASPAAAVRASAWVARAGTRRLAPANDRAARSSAARAAAE